MFGRTCVSAGFLFLMAAICPRAYAQAQGLPPSVVPAPVPADPPPAAVEIPARDREHGLVLVPCFGMNVPLGTLTDGYTQGFHLGALAGWHLAPRFSLNGGLALDLMSSTFDSSIFDLHEYYLDASFTPLVHFQSGAMFIGPQIGWFVNSRSRSDGPGGSNLFSGGQRSALPGAAVPATPPPTVVKHSGHGLLLGVTAGAFAPVGRLALGLVAGGGYRRFISADCEGAACADRLGGVVRLDVSLAALY
jgi:hypothetical protein